MYFDFATFSRGTKPRQLSISFQIESQMRKTSSKSHVFNLHSFERWDSREAVVGFSIRIDRT